MTSIKKDLLSGVFYTAIAKYSGILISLVIAGILARLIAPEEFGIVAVVTVIISFFSIFSDLGVAPAIIQNTPTRRFNTHIFIYNLERFNSNNPIFLVFMANLDILQTTKHGCNNPITIHKLILCIGKHCTQRIAIQNKIFQIYSVEKSWRTNSRRNDCHYSGSLRSRALCPNYKPHFFQYFAFYHILP